MLKKLRKRLQTQVSKIIRKPRRQHSKPASPIADSPPSSKPQLPDMRPPKISTSSSSPFLFPQAQSSVLPDPSTFFSPNLLSSPLPTNSFFQNYTLNVGANAEYLHPYLIKSSNSSISISYPTRFFTPAFIYQTFVADLTISAVQSSDPAIHPISAAHAKNPTNHIIQAFHDLSLTLDVPPTLRFFLVRGCPYVTCATLCAARLSIATVHAVLSLTSNASNTKHVFKLNNGQTWVCYSSSPLKLSHTISLISSPEFSGILRFAVIPSSGGAYETVLDRFSCCYPVSGDAMFTGPYCLQYKWEKRGWGDLLLLAHPLHLRLLSPDECDVEVLGEFKYRSIDGDLVGVVGDSWVLKTDPISVTWHSISGVGEEFYLEVTSALQKDVDGLKSNPITMPSSYFYGKAIARAARLALIAEEVCFPDAIPAVRQFLQETITPWLDGSFNGNGFLYDRKWGGIITRLGSSDSGADFGFGIFNDHHYHLGYFLYAIAVLCQIDPAWGRKYRPQAYSMVADFMNLGRHSNSNYLQLSCFDLWKLHSWAGGLSEYADGRNQVSTSEAVNAYFQLL